MKFGQLILRNSIKIVCHQMSNFKAKMHQNRFRLGLRPRPRWGAYSAPPDPLAGLRGPIYFLGREGKGEDEEERGGDGRGRKKGRRGEKRGEGLPYVSLNFP